MESTRVWMSTKVKSRLKHCFSDFFLVFGWNIRKTCKINKKGWKWPKIGIRPAFKCTCQPKAGQNTQQMIPFNFSGSPE